MILVDKNIILKEINRRFKAKYNSLDEIDNYSIWGKISSRYHDLSESFIREFQDKIEWEWVSIYQTLSEDIIREFKDKVYWGYILTEQKLSTEFIDEFY